MRLWAPQMFAELSWLCELYEDEKTSPISRVAPVHISSGVSRSTLEKRSADHFSYLHRRKFIVRLEEASRRETVNGKNANKPGKKSLQCEQKTKCSINSFEISRRHFPGTNIKLLSPSASRSQVLTKINNNIHAKLPSLESWIQKIFSFKRLIWIVLLSFCDTHKRSPLSGLSFLLLVLLLLLVLEAMSPMAPANRFSRDRFSSS